MWNRILIIILLFYSTGFQSEDKNRIEWEEVKNAPGYVLEVRDENNNLVRNEKVTKNTYEIENLQPGKYQHRVAVQNKFGKPGEFSKWTPFNVTKSLPPEIEPPLAYHFPENEKDNSITVKGKNFLDVTKVHLVNEKGEEVNGFNYEIINENEIRLTLDTSRVSKGSYSLLLENPRNKSKKYANFYFVESPKEVAGNLREVQNTEPVGAKGNENIEPEKTTKVGFKIPWPNFGFYANASIVNWKSSALENSLKLQNSNLINNIALGGRLYSAPSTTIDLNKSSVQALALDLGVLISPDSKKWRGRFGFKEVSSYPSNRNSDTIQSFQSFTYYSNINYSISNYNINDFDRSIYKRLNMYSLKYNHEYFAFSESKNNYLRPLGFQGGINFQYDGFRSKRFSLESFSQTSSTVFSGSSNSASFSTFYFFPIPKETNYINYSTFLNLGLTYKLDIAVNKEIEFGLNYLIGKSRGSNEFQTVGLVVGNYLPYTALTKFNSNITGSQLNIAYNYKLNEKRGFRFFMENRILNYNVNNSKTVVENITSLPVNDNGIISKVSDQMSSIGVEYYHNL